MVSGPDPVSEAGVGVPDDATAAYAAQLKTLWQAARGPTGEAIRRQALTQPTPLKVTVQSWSDWLNGKNVPSDRRVATFLIAYLRGQVPKNSEYRAPPDGWWEKTRQQALAERRAGAGRGGRPTRRTTPATTQPGRPLAEVTDPFQLEVHRPIEGDTVGLPDLPVYVPREHDHTLAQVVVEAVEGARRIAVLVGGSSTGKTRACWEALDLLRKRPEPWRVWHPIDPTRPDAALAELPRIGPFTVVWLNEAQDYLSPDPLGEQVAAGLRNLLRTRGQGPVLVLATLWSEHWDSLITRPPPGQPDLRAQARELLDGHAIHMPASFTVADLEALAGQAGRDPRLAEAGDHARDGRITQYLAGGPVLVDRYQQASPATRALINAAMDARRLGAGPRLPWAWLAEAAPGYLTEAQWEEQTGNDWLEQALDYVTKPCKGIPGILIPVRAGTPRNQRTRRAAELPTGSGAGALYRLADYLDQYGRRHRADQVPPVAFWTAAAAHAHPADMGALGNAAWALGLYRDAIQLDKHATTHGDPAAARTLVDHLHALHPADRRPAHHAAAHITLEAPDAAGGLLTQLNEIGAQEPLAALLAREPAAHVPLDSLFSVTGLLGRLREVGAQEQVAALAERAAAHAVLAAPEAVAALLNALRAVEAQEPLAALLARNPAAHVVLDDWLGVERLLRRLREIGAGEQVAALAERAVAHVAIDDPGALAHLLAMLYEVGALQQMAALLARDPAAHIALDGPTAVIGILAWLRAFGALEQTTMLAKRIVNVSLDDPFDVLRLLHRLREIGEQELAIALAERAVAHIALNAPSAVAWLLEILHEMRAQEQVDVLLARNPAAHTALDKPIAVIELLDRLREMGAQDQVATLATRAAAHAALDDPFAVVALLDKLSEIAPLEETAMLAERAAARAALDVPYGVAVLLDKLREIATQEQAVTLVKRAAANVALDDPHAVIGMLDRLRDMGAQEQVAMLLARNPAAHIALDDPYAVVGVLDRLRDMGEQDQVAVLLARNPAAHISLGNPTAVTRLLDRLREMGAQDQVAAFVDALPAAGHFDQFLTFNSHPEQFWFGREPDGSPATPWSWDDLE